MGIGRTLLIFLRSALFFICFCINFLALSAALSPCLIIRSRAVVGRVAKFWNWINVRLLRIICGVKYKVEGAENIPDSPALILFRHESTWETYFLYQYFKIPPVIIAKKELLYIPIFGFLLKGAGNILVDRKAGISSIKELVRQAKRATTNEKRSILISPQGTRVPIGGSAEDYPYRSGFCAVMESCDLPLLPVALDSGKAWPKGSFLKYPCVINVKFLPLIPREITKNMDKDSTVELVKNLIEEERKKMG